MTRLQTSRSAFAVYKPQEIMVIDNKLTERGKTNTFAEMVKVFPFFVGSYMKLIISSYKSCFLATIVVAFHFALDAFST